MSSEQIANETEIQPTEKIETDEKISDLIDTTTTSTDVRQMSEEAKSQSAEELALLINKQQQQSLAKSNENIIVSNFLKFFEPLVQNLDSNVEALRTSQYELTNQIKSLLNRKLF